MAPKAAVSALYALLIKKQWCQKIFRGSKTRRGKFAESGVVAGAKSTWRNAGASQLVGEVDAVGCLSVGVAAPGAACACERL